MNLSCSSRTIKYLMFGFNLFFVISGIIIIAVGAAVKTVYTDYSEFLDTQYFSLPNMLIATGSFIFIISFFGCCGAIKESWIMLGIFSICLCIIFIFEFACGIAGYVLRDQTAAYLEETLTRNLDTYNTTHDIWDAIQGTFKCCGAHNYTDWGTKFPDYHLPISCCPPYSGTTGVFYCNSYVPPSTISPSSTSEITPTTAQTTPTVTGAPSTESTVTPTTVTETSTTVTTTTTVTSTTATPTTTSATPSARRKRNVGEETPITEATTVSTAPTVPTPPNNSTSAPYPIGCQSAFGDYIKQHAVQIGGCALGLAIVQLLGIVFSCHLVRQLKNGYYST